MLTPDTAPQDNPAAENDLSLSELQLSLMRVVWQRRSASTAEITEALQPERDLAHTTVATLLSRLEKRGLLRSEKDGRQLRYHAIVSEPEVQRSMVTDLLGSLFGGNPKALLSHLLREEELGADDLDAARALLAKKGRRDA